METKELFFYNNKHASPPKFPGWYAVGITVPMKIGDVLVRIEYNGKNPGLCSNSTPEFGKKIPAIYISYPATHDATYSLSDASGWCVYRRLSQDNLKWFKLKGNIKINMGDVAVWGEGVTPQKVAEEDHPGGEVFYSSGQSVSSYQKKFADNNSGHGVSVFRLAKTEPERDKLEPLSNFHSKPLPLP